MTRITQQIALEYLRYDQETGWLFWIKKASDKTVVGSRAGWSRSFNGYRQVGFIGETIYEHRLVWLIVTGRLPSGQIDHRNGIKDDNRFENLREANSTQNLANIGAKRDNTSGVKNVHWCNSKSRWIVKLKKNGKTRHIGTFRDYESAVAAADSARISVHGAFASQLGCDAEMVARRFRNAKE